MEVLTRAHLRAIPFIKHQSPPTRFALKTHRQKSSVWGTPLRIAPAVGSKETAVGSVISADAVTSGAGTVRIIVKGRRLEITEAIRDYVEKKLSRALHHYAPSIKTAEATLSVRGGDTGTKGAKEQKTEVTIWTLRNGVVRSEEVAASLYASIDLVCDKVERKLQKVKEIAMEKGKWPGRGGHKGGMKLNEAEPTVTDPVDFEEEIVWEPEIVRTKHFLLESTTATEAAKTLENLGHSFYVYRDKDTQKVQVVYKRKEYGYGVIIPADETAAAAAT